MSQPTNTNRERVYQAVVDLVNARKAASRETVAKLTRLPLRIVDDHLKRLATDERLTRPARGIFEPAVTAPEDRAFSVTVLPTGRVKVEIEDGMFDLSFRESYFLGATLMGHATMFDRPGASQGLELEFRREIARTNQRMSALERTINQAARQHSLEFVEDAVMVNIKEL